VVAESVSIGMVTGALDFELTSGPDLALALVPDSVPALALDLALGLVLTPGPGVYSGSFSGTVIPGSWEPLALTTCNVDCTVALDLTVSTVVWGVEGSLANCSRS
jgi:hypothetical protein